MSTYPSRPNLAPTTSNYTASPSPGPSGCLQPGTKVQVGKYVVKVDKFLSEGGFAHVYVASLVSPASVEGFSPNQNTFVLKRMAVPDKAGLVEVRKEVDVMKQLRPHKHIVYFIEASASSLAGTSGYEIFILMELCSGGGIIDLLNSRLQNRLTESEILKIFSDTVDAVAHMHSQRPVLIHRDLKVENILVAAPNLYKLCDFGSTTTPLPRPPQSTAEIQALEADLNKHTTLQYRAPEMVDVWSRRGVTEKADIWALGVFLYKLCYYTTPFEEHGPLAIINVQYVIPPFPAYSNSIKHFIGTMLQELPQNRPDIWQVHDHVCKLRGIQSNLKRPEAKSSSSSGMPGPSGQRDPSSTTTGPSARTSGGLDAIFTPAPPVSSVSRQVEAVVPMRRGRPTTRPKEVSPQRAPGPAESFENGTTPKDKTASNWNLPKPTAGVQAPEASDLFAREAAAGFGDAFMSTSPNITSDPSRTAFTSLEHKQPQFSSSIPLANSTPPRKVKSAGVVSATASKTSLPFDDLVSTTKKPHVPSMNALRGSHVDSSAAKSTTTLSIDTFQSSKRDWKPSRPAKRDSFTGPMSTSHLLNMGTANRDRGSNTFAVDALSHKTGPELLDNRINKEIPSLRTELPPKTPPALTLSDWLKKDQAKLVSRSVQTSPNLLSGLISELIPNLPPKDTSGPKSFPPKVSSIKPAPVNLLDDDDDVAASAKLGFGVTSGANRLSSMVSQGSFPSTINAKALQQNEPTSEPPLPSRPLRKAEPSTGLVSHARKPTQDTNVSSGSDDGPEDAEGLVKFSTRVNPMRTTLPPKPDLNFPKKSLNPSQEQKSFNRQSQGYNQVSAAKTFVLSAASDSALEPTTAPSRVSASLTPLSDVTTTTEEDEEVIARRRAAIAKFAPPAASSTGEDNMDRDPFSSRAQTRSPSPQGKLPSTLTGSRLAQNSGPPLRAPKPQSLKSAAAITSLVSRYESLSATDPQSPVTSPTSLTNKRIGVKSSTTGNGQRSSFKPVSRPSSNAPQPQPPSSSVKSIPASKTSNVGRKPTGSGGASGLHSTIIKEQAENDPIEETEEVFNGVTNMKSRWETGAVKRAEAKVRAPRTDYGQL